MKLILLRHGQSTLNQEQRHQFGDTPLSKLGQQQAHIVAKKLQNFQIDKIMVSKQTRAIETATIINTYLAKSIEQIELLNEIKRPSAIMGKHHHHPEIVKIKTDMKTNFHDPAWRYADEENFHDLKQRALSFLNKIDLNKTNNLLVVSHGMFIRVLLGIMLNGESFSSHDYLELEAKVKTENTCISVCEFQQGEWQIHTMCDDTHLTESTPNNHPTSSAD